MHIYIYTFFLQAFGNGEKIGTVGYLAWEGDVLEMSRCICTYICIHMFLYIYVYMRINLYMYVYIYIKRCLYMYVFIYTDIFLYL
jgi:hypothetical protein